MSALKSNRKKCLEIFVKINQFYFKSSKTQYNTSIVSLISLEFILITQKVTLSYLLQQYLHCAPVQVRKGSLQKKMRNPHVHWSLIFEALGEKQIQVNKTKKNSHSHTHSSKVYSPEQSSHENSPEVSDTRFIPYWNHAGELVVTA